MSFRALFLTSAPQNKAFRLVQAGYKSPLTISTLKCGMIFFFTLKISQNYLKKMLMRSQQLQACVDVT